MAPRITAWIPVQPAEDGRGQVAVPTDAGLSRLKSAWPLHLASVRGRILDHLSALDAHALLTGLDVIAEACAKDGRP
jgi:hypothetical protein